MLPIVKQSFKDLLSVIQNFKSPAYKDFFKRKAVGDFNEIKNNIDRKCKVTQYLENQKDLIDVLKRQTVIYNMFYDSKSEI